MNLLAHAYLSFNDDDILVGNMISDFVKGIKQYDYDEKIQRGIKLHRLIDHFADDHNATREAAKLFQPAVGRYAGAFIDVVYDHYLALDENELNEKEWMQFTLNTYDTLAKYNEMLPKNFQRMLPVMRQSNWLYHYRHRFGVKQTFANLVKRAAYLETPDAANLAFDNHYDQLKTYYEWFWPDLKQFVSDQKLTDVS